MKVGDMVCSKNKPPQVVSLVGWKVSFDVDVIVNTNCSVLQPSGDAAGGVILRNSLGICLAAFAANFGICTITRAELQAAIHGLHIAWELGYRKVNLQINSAAIISLLRNTSRDDMRHRACLEEFRELINRDWIVRITHTYREGNQVANRLAHRGHALPFGMHPVVDFSSEIIDCIKTDMIGISFPRSIIINT
ncbi:Putative ribonuclease H protein At1g65750 [Linum grandiflorum]